MIAQANRPEWTLCAFDGGRMVASYSTIPLTTRANGKTVAAAGVSAVGTLPEYRRQGLVRRLTTQALNDMYERGQLVAALWASQAAIYQRYGYTHVGQGLGLVVHQRSIGATAPGLGSRRWFGRRRGSG